MGFFEAENVRGEIHDGAALLWIEVRGRSLNVLHRRALADLEAALEACMALPQRPRALGIVSGRPSGFLAGADVREFSEVRNPQDAEALSERGQRLFDLLESLPIPSVAIVQGPCLGGGLELALACDFRVAIDHPKTRFGLPEIRLGLIPGWGGTQRLPCVVGMERALQMILAQRQLDTQVARAWGLVDAVLPAQGDARALALHGLSTVSLAKRPKRHLPLRTWRQRLLESTGLGRTILLRGAEAVMRRKTPEDMPAPAEALEALRLGVAQGREAGLAQERAAIGRLAGTAACRNLVALFFDHEASKEMPQDLEALHPRAIRRVGVVGAGTMGAGIAQLAALKGCDVVVREANPMALGVGMMRITGLFDQAVRRGVLSSEEARRRVAAIKGTVRWEGFDEVDLVVEAVLEDLELKKRVFSDLEKNTKPDTILATNTSSLGITRVQEGLRHPNRVGALHFFNPVHKMPLVEVGHSQTTSETAVAALVRFALDLGKVPVAVRDGPGFVVNRILIPYLNEAVLLVIEGMTVARVDEAATRFGMLMGPLEVLDEVGLDVAAHIARSAQTAFAERIPPNPAFEVMTRQGWLGQKSKVGFYRHLGKKKTPHAAVETTLRAPGTSMLATLPPAAQLREARDRLILIMINEAAAVVGEGLVAHPDLIDRAMVFGAGWAPHRGGPLRYADDRGVTELVAAMNDLAGRLGPRFAPCAELRKRQQEGGRFRTPLPS